MILPKAGHRARRITALLGLNTAIALNGLDFTQPVAVKIVVGTVLAVAAFGALAATIRDDFRDR